MYNKTMDNQDLQRENEMSSESTQIMPEATAPVSEKRIDEEKKKRWIIAGSSSFLIIFVVIMASVMTITMQRNNNDGQGNGGTSVVDDEEEETETDETLLGIEDLKSGTVTTTIDGRSVTYKAQYVVDGVAASIKSGTYESTSDDEVVFLVINGGTLSLEDGVVINKSGSENFNGRGDSYSFYGTNSAVVVVGEKSQVGITDTTINTSVDGANAVVATDGGSVVFANIAINTTKDASRGLHATYKGKIVGNDGTISTQGQSCAALATDRGEGTVKVSGMTLSTAGAGSPLIYSTGEIEVASSTGTATGAQIAVVEGKNSIVLKDCDFSANGIGNRNSVDNAGVMIYQSMSGDASVGVGSFEATDCKLTVLSTSSVYTTTPFFFVTNTEAEITLSNVEPNFYEDSYFVLATGTDEWGRSGANGGVVTLETSNLTTTNTNVGVDDISSVNGA